MKTKLDKYRFGFEIECYFSEDSDFSESDLEDRLADLHSGIELHEENTIYPPDNSFGTEIVTPPLVGEKAFELLKKIFGLIRRMGGTDESCGLHVNISPLRYEEFDKMNLLYIAFHPVFEEIVHKFDREDCIYCVPNELPKNLWHDMVFNDCNGIDIQRDKDAAVNLDYIKEGKIYGRIEVRAFGNDNYHLKFPLIKKYVSKIIDVLNKSKQAQFDYMK